MTQPKTIADNYLDVWNETDATERRALLNNGWAANALYSDPIMTSQGREGVATMIEGARTQFPGHRFTLRGTPDGHGAFVRFSWTLAPVGGVAVGGGTDIVRLDGDGRIAEVIGFLDGSVA
jgi:hypothetical protein